MPMDKSDTIVNSDIAARANLVAIVESSDDIIISKTLDGIITSWNKSAEKILGFSTDEAIGKHITLIIPKDRFDEEHIIIGKIKAGQKVDHFETVRKKKNGELISLSITVSPIKSDEGVIIGASKIARDINDIKEAEETKAYLASIVDSSDDIIISKDLNGIITSWNRSAEKIFGYSVEEAIGKHINLIIPSDKYDEEHVIIAKVKSGQKIDHFETVRRAKSGRLIDISITVSPIYDSKRNIIGASKVAKDITEHKRVAHELLIANQKKDDFIASISHELRTPMTAIMGLSHILERSNNLDEKERSLVQALHQSSANMMVLINNLLDFAKAEADAFEMENIEFCLLDSLQLVMGSFEAMAEDKNINLKVVYNTPIRKFYLGDPFKIQQVLNNVIGNAIKFTDKGSVVVCISGEEKEKCTEVCIEVNDSGIGIEESKIDYIFEKFVQGDSSVTRRYGGSGLGLSLAKTFLLQMRGSIDVNSEVGIGTTFTIKLHLDHTQDDQKISATPSSKKNILVVEDYEPNILVLTMLLDIFKYTYDVAKNGLEGLKCYSATNYDVVLMDIQMEAMDGLESTRRIRAYEIEHKLFPTPIIAVSAHITEKDKWQCIQAGMDDFMPKPYNPDLLQKKLSEIIDV